MGSPLSVSFTLDGHPVVIDDEQCSLLEAVRNRAGARTPKDGCSPQGQCGCCTVLVDGQPRVACVTPVRRVRDREVTTVDGLPAAERVRWAEAFCAAGASQCGFCTPGIILRLTSLRADAADHARVEQALLAHLCRCTGWRTILDAWDLANGRVVASGGLPRDLAAAARRAELEGRAPQRVGPAVALGGGGFADDVAPPDALVAVPDGQGGWAVGDTLEDARAEAAKVQGRHSTSALSYPVELPAGDWDVTLQTTWVEPAYLEVDASWCRPGARPATPLANGGAFGGKVDSPVADAARRLADEHGRTVRVLWSREDSVRLGPKRPPLAAGVDRKQGRVRIRVARAPGRDVWAASLAAGLGPDIAATIDEVDIPGPPTSNALRAAGWAEGVALRAALRGEAGEVGAPDGGRARAELGSDGALSVWVDAGRPLDEVVLRSYCIGAAHMALGWVTSEGIAVDAASLPVDLTIRSFGVLRAVDTPPIEVTIEPSDREPVNGSDAVFAAVAACVWKAQGFPPRWPTGRRLR